MQLAIAIDLAAVGPDLPDQLSLTLVFQGPPAQRSLQPGVEAARLEAQAPALRPHRERSAMLGHERVSHFATLAKYAVAFLKMPHSSVIRGSSRFRRRISASFSASPDDAFANLRFHA